MDDLEQFLNNYEDQNDDLFTEEDTSDQDIDQLLEA